MYEDLKPLIALCPGRYMRVPHEIPLLVVGLCQSSLSSEYKLAATVNRAVVKGVLYDTTSGPNNLVMFSLSVFS
jgi:hypothetical protein